MNYTTRWNKNRGYMKLDVWQKALMLYQLVQVAVCKETRVDFKSRSQIVDAAQSVSANIAEGYSRRSINEYIQFLYIALASLSETLTRAVGLKLSDEIASQKFDEIDALHYEVENKLLRLIERLEGKKKEGTWITQMKEDTATYEA